MDYNSFKYFTIYNWVFYLEAIIPNKYSWIYDVNDFMLCNDNSNYFCTVLAFILFHLDCLDDEEAKYPILQLTLGVICSIITLCGTSYLVWDIALRDMWINPEMWNELLNL